MNEILGKRNLYTKHFDNGDGTFTMQSSAGQIHYFDKLGSQQFEDINHTLLWDDNKRGWYFITHSFNPFIPEYADDWVEFRDLFDDKDQTIKFKAHCKHIKGRLVNPELGDDISPVNYIVYDNAFGDGKDYILYFNNAALKKVVRIREDFKGKNDEQFTWDIEFPKNKDGDDLNVYRTISKEDVETQLKDLKFTTTTYQLDVLKSKTFDTDKKILIGNTKLDGKEWFTYIENFKVWDSGVGVDKKIQTIVVDYDADKSTLTKTIPADFIVNSIGDVFTDSSIAPTPNTNDGNVHTYGSVWSTVHDATSGGSLSLADNAISASIQCTLSGGTYYIRRYFLKFDTSGIGSGSTVTAADLAISVKDNQGFLNDATMDVVSSTFSDTLTLGDYDAYSTTEWGNGEFGANGTTFHITFNATGYGSISKTGETKLCVLNHLDRINSEPNNTNQGEVYAADNSTNKPVLTVTYTAGSTVTHRLASLGVGS